MFGKLRKQQMLDAPMSEASHRENNTVLFDDDYVTGINAAARTGNILFDFTSAKLGATTVMKHQDAGAFTFPAEADLMFDVSAVSTSSANYFKFTLTNKTASAEVVEVELLQETGKKVSPFKLLQEGATNGQALVWSDANQRYQPGSISGGSKWTDVTGGIFRNGAVAIGRTTIPTNNTFSVRSTNTVVGGDVFFLVETNNGTPLIEIRDDGRININGGPITSDNGGTTIRGFVSTTDSIFRVYSSDNTEQFRIRGTGMTTFTSSFVHIGNPSIPIRNAGPHIRGAATDGLNRIFTVMNSANTIAFSIRGDLTTHFQGNLSINDTNLILGTTTGTKIGTATNQLLSFWNATPIVQPTTAVASGTLVSNAGTTLTNTDTIDGYTLQQVVRALRNTGLLA